MFIETTIHIHKSILEMLNKRAEISKIGDVIRRFAELIISSQIKDSIVIIDGNLEAVYTYEDELIPENICGLSKTNELLTYKGNSCTAFLTNLTEKKTWCVKISNTTDVYFVKLHKPLL